MLTHKIVSNNLRRFYVTDVNKQSWSVIINDAQVGDFLRQIAEGKGTVEVQGEVQADKFRLAARHIVRYHEVT